MNLLLNIVANLAVRHGEWRGPSKRGTKRAKRARSVYMAGKLIYIADDEVNILNIIKVFLEREGFEVETFTNGTDLLEAHKRRPASLLVIDIMMPEMDGYTLCAAVRQISSVPIIIVSAKDTEADRIAGLTIGSDDYLTKPFSPMELVARVKALLRRVEMDTNQQRLRTLQVADVVIDPNTKTVTCRGQEVPLTGLEFSVLHYMVMNRYRAVSRAELLDEVWGFETVVETRATDDAVKRIRAKLAKAGSSLKIDTVWGFGFRVRERD